MGADESGTLAQMKALRKELIDTKIAEYRGRLVKTTGDGLLVEFPSVIDAVQMAVEVQRFHQAEVPLHRCPGRWTWSLPIRNFEADRLPKAVHVVLHVVLHDRRS